jgi:hypothetical protein
MPDEFLATRIAKGRPGVAPKASWWPRHAAAFRDLLDTGLRQGAEARTREAAVRGTLLVGAKEWDLRARVENRLMERHARLEIALVRAARSGRPREIGRVGGLLIKNAGELAALPGSTVASFPEDSFRRLVEEHVSLVAGAVRLGLEGGSTAEWEGRWAANTLALAAFTVEWL